MAETYPKKVSTTFSVSFSISSDGILKAEVDDREEEDGGKNLKTSFAPGDPVWCLAYTGQGVKITGAELSHGSLSPSPVGFTDLGGESVKKEESITFESPDSLTHTLSYPTDAYTFEWVGDNSKDWAKPQWSEETCTLTAVAPKKRAIAIGKVTYEAKARSFKLTHSKISGIIEYEIAILLYGEYAPKTAP